MCRFSFYKEVCKDHHIIYVMRTIDCHKNYVLLIPPNQFVHFCTNYGVLRAYNTVIVVISYELVAFRSNLEISK